MSSISRVVVFVSAVAAAVSQDTQPVVLTLTDQTFAAEVAVSNNEDWIVLFCKDSEGQCAHLSASYRQLSVVWNSMSLLSSSSHLGEVNCASSGSLCRKEGIDASPTAVHYRDGKRISAWTVRGQDRSPVMQLMGWVKQEILSKERSDAATKEVPSDANPSLQVTMPSKALIPLFSEMEIEAAAIGYCLVFGAVALIGWVIIEGFELWPKGIPVLKEVSLAA
mmetsp:Transcript_96680/g.167798  ORF Transcript_96680/g.167798 Transcript_96680/m.167798 type:complete len:222 (-) Transcript_96680:421-1086(-)